MSTVIARHIKECIIQTQTQIESCQPGTQIRYILYIHAQINYYIDTDTDSFQYVICKETKIQFEYIYAHLIYSMGYGYSLNILYIFGQELNML